MYSGVTGIGLHAHRGKALIIRITIGDESIERSQVCMCLKIEHLQGCTRSMKFNSNRLLIECSLDSVGEFNEMNVQMYASRPICLSVYCIPT